MPTILETFQEFHERHGSKPMRVHEGDVYSEQHRPPTGRMIYADGAQYWDEFDRRLEPPEDPKVLLGLKLEYIDEQISRARTEFASIKTQLLEQASLAKWNRGVPEPAAEDVEHLKRLRTEVQRLEGDKVELQCQLMELEGQLRNREAEEVSRQLEDQRLQRITDVVNAAIEVSLMK